MMNKLPKGWEIKKLGEVLVKTEMVDPTKNPDKEFTYLDVSSVNKETKEIEGATVLLGKDAPSRARKLVRVNDVIFATVRPTHSRKSLPEQQRIVSILDEAFAAIAKAKANAEQNLKNAKELFESYLQGVFENGNWESFQQALNYLLYLFNELHV
jgi:type I restriction enzyme, S subunit